jgi:hypothetical protein
MKTTVNIHTFREAFNRMGRGGHFSYEGLGLLFDYLEELEHCEEEYELDVVALCCDFAEDTPLDIAENYSIELDGLDDDPEAVKVIVSDWLGCVGVLVGATDTTIVYRQF